MFQLITNNLLSSVYKLNTQRNDEKISDSDSSDSSRKSENNITAVSTKNGTYFKNLTGIKRGFGSLDREEDVAKARKKYEKKIMAKLEAGKPLTPKEKNFLKKYNPEMYMQVVRIENKRKALESKLKHCRSKEEAQDAFDTSMSSISKDDPIKKYLMKAIEYTMKEFEETSSYKKLPATAEQEKNKSQLQNNKLKTDKAAEEDREECDEGDPILYQTILGGYQEAFLNTGGTADFVSQC